jgi:hypothetical protein
LQNELAFAVLVAVLNDKRIKCAVCDNLGEVNAQGLCDGHEWDEDEAYLASREAYAIAEAVKIASKQGFNQL